MNKLIIGLGTRGRPALLLDTVARTLPNITNENTRLHLLLDADDEPTVNAAHAAEIAWPHDRVVVDVREREDTVGAKFNRVLAHDADVYLPMVDHSAHVTPGFDQKILDAASIVPDGVALVVNHLSNASFAGLYGVTRGLADAMGYVFPEYFPYWFIDHWVDDVARMSDRMVFADVRIDSSKKPFTQELREPAWWATFFDACYLMRRKTANDIIWAKNSHEPLWRKRVLESRYPLVEYRSRWVNDSVRGSAQALSHHANLSINDTRYQRVRQKAVVMLPDVLSALPEAEAIMFRNYLTPPTQVVNLKKSYA